MKTFLFYLGHPAHWHNVKVVCAGLKSKGHNIVVVARQKDVLIELLDGEPYTIEVLPARKRQSKIGRVMDIFARELKMWKLARTHRPDLMVGTDIVITHVGKALGIPSIILNEDDAAAVPLFAKYGYPYCTVALAPKSCDVGPFHSKHIQYPGYHELAYLHPNHFAPDRKLVKELLGNEPHFILRAASLTAHHDDGRTGIDDDLALQIIDILAPHGKVVITSERPLSKELEPFRMQFHPKHMHHVMAASRMYIGDSQTMAAEAAVLGVPSIRFNDFVGELGYLEELEHRFGLTKGIRTDEPEELLSCIKANLDEQVLADLQAKRQKMLDEMIDVAQFFEHFLESFPESKAKFEDNEQMWKSFQRKKGSGSALQPSI